jgi:hypothetical protein
MVLLESQLEPEALTLLNDALFELGERRSFGIPVGSHLGIDGEGGAGSRRRKKGCVDTVLKMLSNIRNNPHEPKFK